MNIFENLFLYTKELCEIGGVSGDESSVSEYISTKLENSGCEVKKDALGNLIVFKPGKNRPKNKVMVSAHMDEVGFIVNYIDEDGYIYFSPVGGIVPAVVMGRAVKLKGGVTGIIGGKPVHLYKTNPEAKSEQPKISSLYIDIGANSKEEAENRVNLGDAAYFIGEYREFGSAENPKIIAKALDDRFGCAVMLCLALANKENTPFDVTFAFTVQEEVGTRGAGVAAFQIKPDISIVLETTTACDIPGVSGAKQVTRLGNGPVVSFMDRGTVYDRELYKLARETASELGIKSQTKTMVAGGNDSAAIHKAVGGVRALSISAPCRYLHSPVCVLDKKDCEMTAKLAEKMIERLSVL